MPRKYANASSTDEAVIKSVVNSMLASGEVDIEIDDSHLKKLVEESRVEFDGKISKLGTSVIEAITKDRDTIGKVLKNAAADFEKAKKTAEDAKEAAERAAKAAKSQQSNVTFDRAVLRAEADEVFQSLFTKAIAASVKAGETVALPPLKKVDPFFVENDQTAAIEEALILREHVMASGDSGTGKTYPVEQMLRKRGLRYLKVSIADGLSLNDFIAKPHVRATEKGSETYYTLGFLPFSMKHNLVLLLDEVDQCQSEILSILNAAMEDRRLYIAQTGEWVDAGDKWQVFCTCNTLRDTTGNYSGFRLSAALLNRIDRFIKADYLPPKDEAAIFKRVGLDSNTADQVVGVLNGLRACYKAGKLTQAPSTRIGVRIARRMLGQNNDGVKVADPVPLEVAFQNAMLNGLPENELTEAAAVISNGM